MNFTKVTLSDLLEELAELPSDWMDPRSQAIVAQIKLSTEDLRRRASAPTTADIESLLVENPDFIDVARLFLGRGQEPTVHIVREALGEYRLTWSGLKSMCRKNPGRVARALFEVGLSKEIEKQINQAWTVDDILIERLKLLRGRAVAGQKRGRGLEDEIEEVLTALEVPFESRVTFTGKNDSTAKCDFSIPDRNHPKIVIEAKGFEATGSKLSDFIGDVLKIAQAKDYHMYFFLVTDGRGWYNRESDLKRLVKFHEEGLIDMIYTRVRLPDLAAHVKRIYESE